MKEKKNVSLGKMLNLVVLSEREQLQVKGGFTYGGCTCPCPVQYNDISGYDPFDTEWASKLPDWPYEP